MNINDVNIAEKTNVNKHKQPYLSSYLVFYLTWRWRAIFLLLMRSWKVGEEALKVFQAQVCSMACTEGVHWTINNDINVWQIKWLVNNLLTALTSEPLSGIDQPAVPGFVWQWREPLVPPGMNGESRQKNSLLLFQVVSVGSTNQNKKLFITSRRSKLIYLLHSHSHSQSYNELVGLFGLFKSFNLKLLIIFNKHWLLCSQLPCCWFTWKPCKW